TPGSPTAEVCNNIDDDCDGQIDDMGTTMCGVGACLRSVVTCIAGVTQTCTPGTPGSELCNGIDDDCNGAIDDGTTPGVVGNTILAQPTARGGTYKWMLVTRPDVHVYNVYRGTAGPQMPGNYLANAVCLAADQPTNSITDNANPPVGQAFYYVVTSTDACGEG